MNPISGLLIGTLLSVSMMPAKSDMNTAAAGSGQTAVNEARASLAQVTSEAGDSAAKPAQEQAIDLADFALDVREKSETITRTAAVQAAALQEPAADEKPAVTPKAPKRQVLVFKATWCGACQLLNPAWPKLERVNWRVGSQKTDHFRLVDSDERPDLVSRYGITALPTLVVIEDGREINRTSQTLNAVDLAEFYYGRLR